MISKINKLKLIKQLRESTFAGLSACKKALEANDYDLDAATSELKKAGKIVAEKRSGNECTFYTYTKIGDWSGGQFAILMELGCETDFVFKNNHFKDLAKQLINALDIGRDVNKEKTNYLDWELIDSDGTKKTIGEKISEVAGNFGENITLGKVGFLGGVAGSVFAYTHGDQQYGAIVKFDQPTNSELAEKILFNIVVYKPTYLSIESIPTEIITNVKNHIIETFPSDLKNKPEEIQKKIADSQLQKQLAAMTLIDQPNVTNEKQKVKDLIVSSKVKIVDFYVSNSS